MREDIPRIGYMCGVDFQHELGCAQGGNIVYPSVKDLMENRPCAEQCGVVQVKIELGEWVLSQDFDRKIKKRTTVVTSVSQKGTK